MKKFISTIATATLLFAPVAAHANTRAGDSGAIYSTSSLSQPGMARGASGEALANQADDELGAFWWAIAGGVAVIIAILIADDGDDQSPGT